MSDALAEYYATEYHRRNIQVARVIGAEAAVTQALDRAREVKSIPQWLIRYLESAAERLPGLQSDLAAWRDLSPDSPYLPAALPPPGQDDEANIESPDYIRGWNAAMEAQGFEVIDPQPAQEEAK